jgi:acetylornithine deacetylase/succinyl-diaminopimelate desuccinylase-like protein
VVEGNVYARGTADNKGSLVARIAALKAYQAVQGKPPVNVIYVAEGEEESGSTYFRSFVAEHPHYFAADGVIWEEASADQNGVPVMRLGNKGMLHVELSATGPANDIHSRFGGIFPNPVWRLIWAAASIRSPDGSNRIEGFMDDVIPPTDGEERIYEQLAPGSTRLLERHGLNGPFPPMSSLEVMRTLYHHPTTNITGVTGGYTGPGSKTIIPREAKLRVDFRLVPNQRPDRILELLRGHLDRNGFDDISIRTLNTHTPVKTPLSDSFAQLVATTGAQVFGRAITVEPTSSGTGPRHVVAAVSSVPIVAIGASYAGSMIHGPNENIRLDDLRGHAKHVAAIMDAMARMDVRRSGV